MKMRKLSLVLCAILLLQMILVSFAGCSKEDPLANVSFTDKTVAYDGLEKKIEVTGAPVGATVAYTPKNTYIDIGEYKVMAVVTLNKDSVTLEATLSIVKSDAYTSPTEVEAMIAELQKAMMEKNTLLSTTIADLEERHEARLQELNAEQVANKQALATLSAAYTAKVAALEKADTENKVALEAKIAEEKAALDEKITALTNNYNETVAALEKADTENKAALEAKIAEEKTALDGKITALTNNYNETVAALEKADTENKVALEAKIAEEKTALDGKITALEAELTEKLNQLNANYQAADTAIRNELATLKTNTESEMNTLNAKIASVEQQIVAAQTELAKQIADLTSETNAKIKEIQALITELQDADTTMGNRLTVLEEKVAALLTKTYYTVSFETGTEQSVDAQRVEKYGKATAPATPTRDGYVFLGWYYGNEEWSFIGDSVTTDLTLTAAWSEIDNSTKDLAFYPLPDGTYGVEMGNAKYMERIIIPEAYNGKPVSKILNSGFKNASNLKEITIPDSVTSIDTEAFYACTGLTSIVIPDSVTSIGEYTFFNCTGLTSITIPDSVTSIGNYAFRGCKGLTSIVIPDSVTSIGYETFQDCTSLTSIVIPDKVISIGNYAFRGCKGLTSIYYGGTAEQWNRFSNKPKYGTVYFYSETQPTAEGNYWHYVNDVPTKW